MASSKCSCAWLFRFRPHFSSYGRYSQVVTNSLGARRSFLENAANILSSNRLAVVQNAALRKVGPLARTTSTISGTVQLCGAGIKSSSAFLPSCIDSVRHCSIASYIGASQMKDFTNSLKIHPTPSLQIFSDSNTAQLHDHPYFSIGVSLEQINCPYRNVFLLGLQEY